MLVGQGPRQHAPNRLSSGAWQGCAMIGQRSSTMKSGGRGRLSCFVGGGVPPDPRRWGWADLVSMHPDARRCRHHGSWSPSATFSWSSIRNLRLHPRSSSGGMIATWSRWSTLTNHRHRRAGGRAALGIFFACKERAALRRPDRNQPRWRGADLPMWRASSFYGSVEDFMTPSDSREAARTRRDRREPRAYLDISSVQALGTWRSWKVPPRRRRFESWPLTTPPKPWSTGYASMTSPAPLDTLMEH